MKKIIGLIIIIFFTSILFSAEIKVIQPTSGLFQTGSSIPIHWTSSGIDGNVKIVLVNRYKSFKTYVLKNQQPYNKPLLYTVAHFIPAGDYFIRVSKGSINGKSGFFTIRKGAFNPNTQSVSRQGQAQNAESLVQEAIILQKVSPAKGAKTYKVLVEGRNFGTSQDKEIRLIRPGSSNAMEVIKWHNSRIEAFVPEVRPGAYMIGITDKNGTPKSTKINFNVVRPHITEVKPHNRAVSNGSLFYIWGENFGHFQKGQSFFIRYNADRRCSSKLLIERWGNTFIRGRLSYPFCRGRKSLPKGDYTIRLSNRYGDLSNEFTIYIWGDKE